jgi:hypothetical protein
MAKWTPADCPHCEHERRFPGFEAGGWLQQDNNGSIVSCPVCNDDGHWPREDEDRDRKEYGGPISPGMVMTALNECAHDGFDHRVVDVKKLTRVLNGWLIPSADQQSN